MDIPYMIAVVQAYIHHRKDVNVNIKIQNARDIILLRKAYDIALKWFEENNGKLTIIN